MTWFYGMFNAAQYLNPLSEKLQDYLQDQQKQQRVPNSGPEKVNENVHSYAVVYGCNNKAGKAYSYFLMSKGFNLLLIERDIDSI